MTALRAAALQHQTAASGRHARAEAVPAQPTANFGLISPFRHRTPSQRDFSLAADDRHTKSLPIRPDGASRHDYTATPPNGQSKSVRPLRPLPAPRSRKKCVNARPNAPLLASSASCWGFSSSETCDKCNFFPSQNRGIMPLCSRARFDRQAALRSLAKTQPTTLFYWRKEIPSYEQKNYPRRSLGIPSPQ